MGIQMDTGMILPVQAVKEVGDKIPVLDLFEHHILQVHPSAETKFQQEVQCIVYNQDL